PRGRARAVDRHPKRDARRVRAGVRRRSTGMSKRRVPRLLRRATAPIVGRIIALRRGESAVIIAPDGTVRDYEIADSTLEAWAAACVMQGLWPSREQEIAVRRMREVLAQ